jgi:hypothetical protein
VNTKQTLKADGSDVDFLIFRENQEGKNLKKIKLVAALKKSGVTALLLNVFRYKNK